VAFGQGGRSLSFIPAVGGERQGLFESGGERLMYPEDWHPDGKHFAVLFVGQGSGEGAVIAATGDQTPVVFDQAKELDEPHFSPDGKWIAYNADRDGHGMEVYLVPYPPTGERIQVSAAGGGQARWRGDGRELFYLTPEGTMMAVDVNTQNGVKLGVPKPLFETGLNVNLTLDQYAVPRDGKRFLIPVTVKGEGEAQRPRMVIVENWLEELKRLVPTP
jgi:hypothetical protein